jgi:hypothetical protein
MSGKIRFITDYRAAATQLTDYRIAGDWMRLAWTLRDSGVDLTPTEAAAWADLGMLPEEAGQLILDGVTAQRYAEMEQHAEQQAGGPEAYAAQRIRQLLDTGVVLTETDVIRIPDGDEDSAGA